jgi:hypothetical protein
MGWQSGVCDRNSVDKYELHGRERDIRNLHDGRFKNRHSNQWFNNRDSIMDEIVKLKAAAYDLIGAMEKRQNEIRLIQNELNTINQIIHDKEMEQRLLSTENHVADPSQKSDRIGDN